ncbi:MAG TPA: hypothetical protein EYP56_09130 [Planctomycetaceae bacterium]|nr:hypothetical protein [Planctomycetaceae bacterium]
MSPYQLPTIKDARHCWMWIALCVIAFLLTALAVHQLGSSIRSGERIYRATAIVEQCSAGVVADAAAGSEQAGLPSAPSIKSQLLGEQTLRGVLGGLAWAQRQSQTANEALIARVKRSVDVQTSRPSASCMRVAISYTSADRTEAVEVVNALARHYAELHHTRREAIARQRHHEARVAAGAARCELEKAEARLQAFLERQIRRQQQAGPSKPGAATAAQQQPPPSGSPRVQATKSPAPGQRRWLEEQLDSLGKERSRLLADRTPLHPEVLHLDGLIADM